MEREKACNAMLSREEAAASFFVDGLLVPCYDTSHSLNFSEVPVWPQPVSPGRIF